MLLVPYFELHCYALLSVAKYRHGELKGWRLFPWSFFVFALLFSHDVVPDSFVTPTDCSLPGSSCPWDFSGQEDWNGLPFPSPEDFPDPGIEPASPALAGGFFTNEPWGSCFLVFSHLPVRRIVGAQVTEGWSFEACSFHTNFGSLGADVFWNFKNASPAKLEICDKVASVSKVTWSTCYIFLGDLEVGESIYSQTNSGTL